MRISVVIPVYNESLYIKTCLDSLVKQQIKADEIIVVDNNCTDESMVIAKNYPVKIVKEKHQGMINARNAGFNAAQYDIIARCDADCAVPSNWLARIKHHFAKDDIVALSGPIYFHDLPLVRKFDLPALLYAKVMKIIQNHETLMGPNMALLKTAWLKVRHEICLDEDKVHEDIDLAIHIKKWGRIKFDPQLAVWSSSRRIRNNPLSFFVEYPIRLIKTLKAPTHDH